MDAGSLSTRFTYKHLPLAHRALYELSSLTSSKAGDFPAVKLTELCLKLSSQLLQGKSDPRSPLDRQIMKVLEGAAEGELGSRRMGLAMATLHFVERTLGLAIQPGRRRSQIRFRMDESRRRGQKCGAYGTPEFISNAMAAEVMQALAKDGAKSATILDLSVEAGQFPVTFLCNSGNSVPIRLYAVDRDPTALRIAERIFHFVREGTTQSKLAFVSSCRDSLLDPLPPAWPKQFSAIVGNPPWKQLNGAEARQIQGRYLPWLNAARYDVYLAFIARAHLLLAPGGYLSYVLPSTFLFNSAAANVRRLLLENYDILNLTLYPQGSFVELSCVIPISFLARKRHTTLQSQASTCVTYHPTPLGGSERPRISQMVPGSRLWRELPGCVFHPFATCANRFLATDLPGKSLSFWGTLVGGAHLGRSVKRKPPSDFKGIHARHIRAFHVCFRQTPAYSQAVARFERPPDASWIDGKKVVIQELRYMTHRERLVAASTGSGTCAVSTAMMFFPREENYCDFFAALLNSQLANAWYKLRDVSRSIKLTYLRELPVPFDLNSWKDISSLARECHLMRTEFHRKVRLCTVNNEKQFMMKTFGNKFKAFLECRNEIETKVFDLYGLSRSRRTAVYNFSDTRVF
jgi:hypothetical protein